MLVILLKLYYVEYSTKKKPFVLFSPLIICLGRKEKKENP